MSAEVIAAISTVLVATTGLITAITMLWREVRRNTAITIGAAKQTNYAVEQAIDAANQVSEVHTLVTEIRNGKAT